MSTNDAHAPRLAFEVDIQFMRCIVFAATPAKARWIAVRSFWDAGYGCKGQWPNAKAVRVPRLDASSLREREAKAWVPEYAENMR